MARPKSPSKRTERVPTMYTREELAVLKSNARKARMTQSAYTRFMTTGVEPDKKLPTEKDEALLKGVATLQQISKKIEQIDVSDSVLSELAEIRQLLTKGLSR